MQPLELHQPFLDAIARRPGVQVATYPGADHGYTWPGWPSFNHAAAEASFEATVALFHNALHTELTRVTDHPRSAVIFCVVVTVVAVIGRSHSFEPACRARSRPTVFDAA
jgi:hypothetical protein